MPTPFWSTACSRPTSLASAGPGTGWTWPAMPTRKAPARTRKSPTPRLTLIRDWAVRAFNVDLPYDQFLVKQIAADHQARVQNHPDLAALGFLTLGRKFEGSEPDIIDDRLDVIFRGAQGLSIGCARCHDHKYDPISIRDYYAPLRGFRRGERKGRGDRHGARTAAQGAGLCRRASCPLTRLRAIPGGRAEAGLRRPPPQG